jgi:tetratricopeptide (TPR) repeat protein
MRRLMAWMAAFATLSFTAPAGVSADQGDSRLKPLFARLKTASGAAEIEMVEQAIWVIWTRSGDPAIDRLMAQGLRAMANRDFAAGLGAFHDIIARAPGFAEGWNKRATLYYMMGDYRRSQADAEKTLALEPRHFGAWSGLGLIHLALGDEEAALEAFEKALVIHPNLAGADTHIRELRERLRGKRI